MKAVKKKPEVASTIKARLATLVDKHEPLSQRELALRIGIPTMVLNRTLRGDACPNADAIIRMAKYFKVSTDYLLGLEPLAKARRRKAVA